MLLLQLLVDGLVSGCATGVVAVTFALIYTTTRVFHVAHAGLYTLGGYVTWFLTERGLPFALGLLVAIVACAAVGAFIQLQLYGRLARRQATPLVVLIASLGALVVIQNILATLFTPDILQLSVPWRAETVGLGGLSLSIPQLAIVLSSVAAVAALLAFSNRTLLGKRIRAVAANEFLAEITRLEPRRVYVIVMAMASGIVAIPGSLVALDQGLQPYTSTLVLLTATIAVIAGGLGSLVGAFVVSLLLAVLQSASLVVMSGQWSVAATFGLFVLVMIVAPTGLFGRRR